MIQNLNDVTDEFTNLSKKTNNALRLIVQDADIVKDSGTGESRIKKNQAYTLKKKLADVLTEFNAEQVRYREKCKEGMKNYLKCGKYMINVQ